MKTSRHSRAFSLLEILAVVAIALILIGLSIPALRGLGSGADSGAAARRLDGMIHLAGSEARAKSMPIWMGFFNDTSTKDKKLIVATVTSADGSADLSNVTPTGKPETFVGIQLAKLANYGGTNVIHLADGGSDPGFKLNVAGKEIPFAGTLLRFGPSGEVIIPPSGSGMIEVGLQPYNGETAAPANKTAAIQITGLTGVSRILRP